jgi:hypothetical protein
MMMPQPNVGSVKMPPLPDSVRFAAALGQFSLSMHRLSHLQTQTSNRLSKLIRLGMIALISLFISVFVMMFIMAQRITVLVDNVASINVHFHNMVPDISRMHSNMIKMQINMATMNTMPTHLSNMLTELSNIHQEVVAMKHHVHHMEYQTSLISLKTGMLATQLHEMQPSISQIQYNINKTARPMRIFNQFMPRP